MNDRTSVRTESTDISARQANFRQRVIDRDGSCILTGGHENIQACHIIPHSKQDQVCSLSSHDSLQVLMPVNLKYMINLASHRQGLEETVDPPFTGIDDIRNGILLHSAFHRPFGESRVAFLHVSYCCIPIISLKLVRRPPIS